MRIGRLLAMAVAAALLVLPVGPAQAESEPDNWIWQAAGPVTSSSISGTIASTNDVDFYLLRIASQTQLTLTVLPDGCNGSFDVSLRDADGDYIGSTGSSDSQSQTIKYTTQAGTGDYYVRVGGNCLTKPYSIQISPSTSLLGGPGVPTSTTPTGEPNETAQQATGPLSGDIVYTGSLDTSNDEDWFAFWANAAFTVTTTATGGNCSTSLTVFDSDVDYVGGTSASENLIRHFSHTPDGWHMFYLRAEANCVGAGYRFSLSPASAIPLVGPPAPTAPAALPGIGKRKTRTTVVAYWGVATGATSYQVRLHRKHSNSRWKSTSNAWFSIKKHGLRKKTWLQVRAVNGVGPGPIASIRLK